MSKVELTSSLNKMLYALELHNINTNDKIGNHNYNDSSSDDETVKFKEEVKVTIRRLIKELNLYDGGWGYLFACFLILMWILDAFIKFQLCLILHTF